MIWVWQGVLLIRDDLAATSTRFACTESVYGVESLTLAYRYCQWSAYRSNVSAFSDVERAGRVGRHVTVARAHIIIAPQ